MQEVEVKLSAMHFGGRKRVPYSAILKPSCLSAFFTTFMAKYAASRKFRQIPKKFRSIS